MGLHGPRPVQGAPGPQVPSDGMWSAGGMLYRRIVAITQRCLGGNSATSCLGRWALHLLAVSSKALGLAMARSAEPPPPTAEEPFTLLHTRQTLVGLRASEMAYFSTIFKPEVTVTAQAGDADKDQHFFLSGAPFSDM